ncbi:hypothetical protein SAICODRAFT_8717 [Saitoella complicata NRRL Y-17804]|uniref:uncharacterized protein n=1 Tax=Saitoella complicata (strain BCRC 22490 / CBS 7301 / JCM 7358 / NBRC 10748 / NRRL Y-17804) TaxID=698492 RepID=UPI000866FD41|nr:uncharacterized protein SAICODRAFT_8717 [Saitoella complicata NRRL Y-17804]ODQ51790.1 hypothetical protein SAICODRAFT_8717 [Saitoella complicata NRRL Y-17804]
MVCPQSPFRRFFGMPATVQPKTPRQRKAINAFNARENAKRGKAVDPNLVKADKLRKQLPVSGWWMALLMFLLVGGIVLEALRIFF